MLKIIRPGLILFCITVAAVFFLSVTYNATKEPIRLQRQKDKNAAMARLLPEATEFFDEELIENSGGVTEVSTGYGDGLTLGYIIRTETNGYGGVIGVLSAFDTNGTIIGVSVTESSETPGVGDKILNAAFTGQFENKSAALNVTGRLPGDDEIQAVTGATVSSGAVVGAVNAAAEYFDIYLKEDKR